MKKILFIAGMFLLTLVNANAQEQKKEKKAEIAEKIKTERIAYVKKKLALTTDEDKKFTPLYTKMVEELDVLRKSEEDLEEKDLTFMTDEECEKAISEMLAVKEKEVGIIKNYTVEFKKVLPVKKVLMIFKAQEEFKKIMIRKIRQELKKNKKEK